VESAVIRLSVLDRPSVSVQDEKLLFKLIRASFNQRRKTLLNGLKNSPELSFSGDEIAAAIAAAGFDPAVRGEALTLTEFARLSDILSA
jgi:16S rRNA (adenine1518-N6/adenine1519-N6)-dimethyltransferase